MWCSSDLAKSISPAWKTNFHLTSRESEERSTTEIELGLRNARTRRVRDEGKEGEKTAYNGER
jgi:hypothetical protein